MTALNLILLVQKLFLFFGFSSLDCTLIWSYLSGRSQAVSFGDVCSFFLDQRSGVVQGSILGPRLFSCFSNDLASVIRHCSHHGYADDYQIYISGNLSSVSDMVSKLNSDLASISQWAVSNGIPLNVPKTKAICFSRQGSLDLPRVCLNGHFVEYSGVVKNLGVFFDSSMSWEPHINSICKKVHFLLCKFYQIRSLLPVSSRLRIVKSVIIPHFNYCDSLFYNSSGTHLKKLCKALNACTRFVYDLRLFDHLGDKRNAILGMSLERYFKMRVVLFIFSLYRSRSPNYLFSCLKPATSARSLNFILPANRSRYYNDSVFVHGVSLWNSLPTCIKAAESLSVFRGLVFDLFSRD